MKWMVVGFFFWCEEGERGKKCGKKGKSFGK